MATTSKVKKAQAQKSARKAVKKTVKKAAPSQAAKPRKAAAKTAKKAVKKPAAAPAKKSAAKAAVKTAVKSAAVKKSAKKVAKAAVKSVPAKNVVKKASPAKSATKAPVKKVAKAAAKTSPAKKAAPKPIAAPKPVAAPVAPETAAPAHSPEVAKALKGLKGVGGALGARIARIVAESARSAPAAPEAAPRSDATPPSGGEPEAVEVAHKAAALLFAKKAEDVVLLDLRNLSTVADYYLIATCQNEPQMRSMLNDVQRTLSREGIKSLRSEYMSGVRWAVIDYGDLIIHLFESQTRNFYSLERLWADAPSTRLKAEDYVPAGDNEDDEDDDL